MLNGKLQLLAVHIILIIPGLGGEYRPGFYNLAIDSQVV